ncbi:hypothetical protein EON67_00285, partial [archaeon]
MSAGNITATVYTALAEGRWDDARRALSAAPRNRASLSLAAYSAYAAADYRAAAQCYEELCRIAPEVEAYGLYAAQCLYKAGLYPEAGRAAGRVDSPQWS